MVLPFFLLVLADINQTLNNAYTFLFLPALGGALIVGYAWGGLMVMFSGEETMRVNKGKQIIIRVTIGGAIVFLAGTIGHLMLDKVFQ